MGGCHNIPLRQINRDLILMKSSNGHLDSKRFMKQRYLFRPKGFPRISKGSIKPRGPKLWGKYKPFVRFPFHPIIEQTPSTVLCTYVHTYLRYREHLFKNCTDDIHARAGTRARTHGLCIYERRAVTGPMEWALISGRSGLLDVYKVFLHMEYSVSE